MQVDYECVGILGVKNTVLILVLSWVGFAQAQINKEAPELLKPEWRMGLRTEFFFEASNRPTSKEGQTEFRFADLELNPKAQFNEEISTFFKLAMSERLSQEYTTELENAYVQFRAKGSSNWIHEVGIIQPLWHRYEGLVGEVDIFGRVSQSLARRYNFLQDGDLGYQGRYNSSSESFWTFGVVNGEENNSNEVGASKEAFVGYVYHGERQLAGLWLSHGEVDVVDDSIAGRSRALLRYQLRLGRLVVGLEGLWARDPDADFQINERAEGMTFENPDQSITTTAGRVDLYYDLNDKQQILIRYDHLRPELKNKDISSWTTGWFKREKPYFSWGLFYENTLLGLEHSAQARQRENVKLGLSLRY